MEISNLVSERIEAFTGQKSSAPHGILAANDCERIKNFVTRRGRLRKIWGTSLYYESALYAGVSEVKWIDYFRNRWIFQHGDCIGLELAENSQTFDQPGSILLGAANRVFSEKWQNNIYLCNGCENKYLEPGAVVDNFLNLGLTPPGNGRKWVALQGEITLSEVGSLGAALGNQECAYVITFWDSVRRVESMPWGSQVNEDGLWIGFSQAYADSNAATFSGDPDKAMRVDISQIKALGYDEQRVTHFLVYRRKIADGTLTLLTDPDTFIGAPTINNDYYDDTTPEADLTGRLLDESISPPPSGKFYVGYGTLPEDAGNYGPRFVKFFRDQLWMFGVNFPGTPYGTQPYPDGAGFSQTPYAPQSGIAYGSQVGNFEYWQYTYDIGRSTGQKDTGLAKHRGALLFFKDASTYYLEGTSPENYEIRELDNKRGIIAPGSLQETTVGVIGLGAEGFTLFDSVSGGKIISEEIADEVEGINLAQIDKIYSAFDPQEEKYECHVPIENTYNTKVFILDVKSMSWSFTTRAGGAAAYGLSSEKRVVGLLGDAQNGRLYKTTDRSLLQFAGRTAHGTWRSRQMDFGYPGYLKSLQTVTITARAKRDFRLSIDVIPDFAQADCVTINDIDPDVRSDRWAEDEDDDAGMDWDEGQWGANTEKKQFTVLVQAIGKRFQLVIRNSDTDAERANFEIEEISLEASLLKGEDDE